MVISTRGRYGVKAALDLALHEGEGPISTKAIAERQELPEAYLEQLMSPLRKAGIVQSVRGPQGGYLLAKPPRLVTVRAIVEALEGPLAVENCTCGGESPDCLEHTLWKRLGATLATFLEETTLGHLVDERQAMAMRPVYHI